MRKRKKNSLPSIIEKGKYAVKNLPFQVLVKEAVYETHEGDEVLRPMLCVTEKTDLHNFHKKNRLITHTKQMSNSICDLRKVLRPVVVALYNGTYYIIDGQNLYSALVKLGLPIEFYLFETDTEEELLKVMRVMNSSSRRWGIDQFAKVNTSRDKKANAYDKLIEYTEKYKRSIKMTTRVMSAMMFNEHEWNESGASNAVKGEYFVQNVPDVRLKQRIAYLKRFYRTTKMTPTNYLNAGIISLMYDKKDMALKYEKQFFKEINVLANKEDKLSIKFGNVKDAWSFLTKGWKKMNV